RTRDDACFLRSPRSVRSGCSVAVDGAGGAVALGGGAAGGAAAGGLAGGSEGVEAGGATGADGEAVTGAGGVGVATGAADGAGGGDAGRSVDERAAACVVVGWSSWPPRRTTTSMAATATTPAAMPTRSGVRRGAACAPGGSDTLVAAPRSVVSATGPKPAAESRVGGLVTITPATLTAAR